MSLTTVPNFGGNPGQWVHTILDAATRQPIELAMQHLDLSGRVSPAGALLRATHRFKCKGDGPSEVLYVFMLPRQGTLRRFIVKGKDFEMESKLEPRAEAREEYEQGVADGHLSVLAETAQDGLVTLSVGQIRPDEEVSVIVEVNVGVELEDKKFRFRYPFTLAPNYHAQAKASGDGGMELPTEVFGDLILPEWEEKADGLHQISFHLHVEAGGKLDSVGSPSHKVEVRPNDDGSAEVFLSGNNDVPDRDLVVDVKVREPAPTLFVDESVDPKLPKDAARWSALIPSSCFPQMQAAPRRVCFLLDRSGSMDGPKIQRAVAALDAMLAGLASDDEFGLIAFGSELSVFDKDMGKATDTNRERARKWLLAGSCLGGTELAMALGGAVDVLGGPGGDIFMLTDGEVWETGPIIEQAAACSSRIHILGIGDAAQDRFLESLARRTGGVSKMVSVNEDVDAASMQLFATVRQPVQTDATVIAKAGKKSQTHDVGTVWGGKALIITDNGSSGKGRPTELALKWKGGSATVKLASVFPTPNGLSALLWAGRKVGDLETAMDMTGKGPALKSIEQELKAISTAYGLASRVMSLCAVVERLGDQAGEQPEQQVVPVGMPSDMTGQRDAGMVMCASMPSPNLYSSQPNVMFSMDGGRGLTRSFGSSLKSLRSRSVQVNSCVSPDSSADTMGFEADYTPETRTKGGIIMSDQSWSFLGEVTMLMADGGMPGADPNMRFVKTVVLALALLKRDVDSGTAMFSPHLKRMADYIESKAAAGDDWLTQLVAMLRDGTVKVDGDWDTRYETLRASENYDAYVAVIGDARQVQLPA